ncbi:MAG: hypothetical protein MJ170_01185 [Alphaproteobacteria bacterium]|nr:hypothetical protein [Alphaproteobacteria bacterium]
MRRMKFLAVLTLCVFGTTVAFGAVRTSVRGGAASKGNVVTQKANVVTTQTTSGGKTARSAVAARSATPTKTSTVTARAATTQKVVNNGTKIATATTNTVVNEECKTKYYGCMDSFCMLDNTSGGRCLCSDRNADLDKVADEIQRLDEQTYAMATTGVERIEMGADAEDVIAQANAVAQSFTNPNSSAATKRKSLDMSLWTSTVDFDDNSEYEEGFVDAFDGKTGAALFSTVNDLCVQSIPECSAETSMLQLMYSQQVRSDCTAYENSLKQQRANSVQKLAAAESALRDAALEQYRTANKYDLGQCTIEFKKCMITTADCGEDFSKCASVSAIDNTSTRASENKYKTYSIKGAMVSIDIYATTYDTLVAKKPLCENVLRSCDKVKDKVWDTFLVEVAPQLRSAELIAEDNARQNCVSSISSCFQKACKDNIDPNDPDGSYDLCLTRPDTMLNLCKIPLNACGIDTNAKADKLAQNSIWNYVVAVMASMRVDSCTNEVKSCLQSSDRCGEDYTQCVGLDLESIKSMCPVEKLVGCQKDGNLASFDDEWLNNLLQGIYLSIDNSMLDQCQKLVDEKMIEICGDTASCDAFATDEFLGTESLRSTKDSNGNFVISGLVSFGNVQVDRVNNVDDEGNLKTKDIKFGEYQINIDDYLGQLSGSGASKALTKSSLETVSSKINQTIALLSQDAKIQMCINGRDMKQVRGNTRDTARDVVRYPYLLDSAMLTIINSGLDKARANYTKRYNELVASVVEEQNDQVKQALCTSMATSDEPVCTEYDTQDGQPVCVSYAPATDYLGSLFSGNVTNDPYATEYIIPSANVSNLLQMSASASKDYTITDNMGNMLGNVQMSAVYSAKNNTCSLTTTTTMCKDAEAVITDYHEYFDKKKEGKRHYVDDYVLDTQEYHGSVCKEFVAPITTTESIKM